MPKFWTRQPAEKGKNEGQTEMKRSVIDLASIEYVDQQLGAISARLDRLEKAMGGKSKAPKEAPSLSLSNATEAENGDLALKLLAAYNHPVKLGSKPSLLSNEAELVEATKSVSLKEGITYARELECWIKFAKDAGYTSIDRQNLAKESLKNGSMESWGDGGKRWKKFLTYLAKKGASNRNIQKAAKQSRG